MVISFNFENMNGIFADHPAVLDPFLKAVTRAAGCFNLDLVPLLQQGVRAAGGTPLGIINSDRVKRFKVRHQENPVIQGKLIDEIPAHLDTV